MFVVVYGETMPAWEKTFPTKPAANAFATKQRACGDIIFYNGADRKDRIRGLSALLTPTKG